MSKRTMWFLFAFVVWVVLINCRHAHAHAQSPPDDDPMITIDGSKTPWEVPNWRAWWSAWTVMGGPIGGGGVPIPSEIWDVTTPAERDLLRKTALEVAAVTAQLDKKVAAGRAEFPQAPNKPVPTARDQASLDRWIAKMEGLDMGWRREVLAARDRVLPRLNSSAQIELLNMVDHVREGTTTTLRKSELAKYRLPE